MNKELSEPVVILKDVSEIPEVESVLRYMFLQIDRLRDETIAKAERQLKSGRTLTEVLIESGASIEKAKVIADRHWRVIFAMLKAYNRLENDAMPDTFPLVFDADNNSLIAIGGRGTPHADAPACFFHPDQDDVVH